MENFKIINNNEILMQGMVGKDLLNKSYLSFWGLLSEPYFQIENEKPVKLFKADRKYFVQTNKYLVEIKKDKNFRNKTTLQISYV